MAGRKPKKRTHDSSFGRYIRTLRKIRLPKLTIESFAQLVGIGGTYESKIELGTVPPPSKTVVLAMAEALSEDPNTLLAMAGYQEKSQSFIRLDELSSKTLIQPMPEPATSPRMKMPDGHFVFAATPEMLRYWSLLFSKLAEYAEKEGLIPSPIELTHSNIISYALFCIDHPFPEIREEVRKEFIKTMEASE
jgi:transcriptional regulator with XRE-family HTH domain